MEEYKGHDFFDDELKKESDLLRKELLKEIEEEEKKKAAYYEELAKQITPQKGEIKVKDVYLPIPTGEIHYKKPYKDLMHYTLISNFNEFENKHNQERYIYKNKIIFKEVAQMLSVKDADTISRNFKKLIKMGYMVQNEVNKNVYMIKYNSDGKYVTIHKEILKKLVSVYNNDAIAVYLYLCHRLREGNAILQREWICEGAGMNVTKRNLDKVSSITETLENDGLIGKTILTEVRNGKPRDLICYTLASHEEYKSGKYRHLKVAREQARQERKSKAM